ncbi:hypothetical protein DFQ05_0838 [Winogradskyella wandonensis]|uniref:N-acetyltransferase domain-containing protein n=1 Tax=Winogradskyella wandonensis TaxID=1442586 RepID=A0A4R1KXG6_9FLAO|nr:hypothetical protein [Winogradskyella wandonensis]TCK69317.1 hypothetical protein DFQ05_0838 [Winogradskyella wandonensis]
MKLSLSRVQDEITEKDLSYVLKNPWKFSTYEWKLYNIHNEKTAFETLIEQFELCRKDGFSKVFRTPDNFPLLILMAVKISETKLHCYLVASKHMEENNQALKVTFEMRKILEEQSRNYKGCTLVVYSQSRETEKQMSWLRFIGLKYKPEGNVGDSKYFEYEARGNV